jgi:hypothetical protein
MSVYTNKTKNYEIDYSFQYLPGLSKRTLHSMKEKNNGFIKNKVKII